MGTLVLARHGQANFLSDDYDKLSPLGETQAQLLGSFWASKGVVFDAVFSGPRTRQIRTAELAREAYSESGRDLPHAEVIPELDEYNGHEVMSGLLPVLIERDSRVRELVEAHKRTKGSEEQYKSFQRLFERVVVEWVEGTIRHPEVTPWSEFKEQVRRGVARLRDGEGRGRRIVAFTSGGPISVTMQAALGVSDRVAIGLNWQIRNASLTEFIFSKDRFSLDVFNSLPHLDRELWTYR
jgi:broad specificity phosphatase PhoE